MGLTRLLVLVALIGAAASCQAIIGLGDEPTYTPVKAPGCGISKAPGPLCAECLETNCCEKSLACAADPACKHAVETCFSKCFGLECFLTCLEGAGKPLAEYFNCASQCASACDPTEKCKDLSDCCLEQTDATLQAGCINNARSEDQELCQHSYDQLMCTTGAGGAPSE